MMTKTNKILVGWSGASIHAPNLTDLGTSTQIFFTGVITSMASTIHDKFGVSDLR